MTLPIFVYAEFAKHSNPSLPAQFGAAMQAPNVTGALIVCYMYSILNGDYSDIQTALNYMNTNQTIILFVLPIPCGPGYYVGTTQLELGGSYYPCAWTEDNQVAYMTACTDAYNYCADAGFTVVNMRNAQSVPTDASAWNYYVAYPPGSQAYANDWIAAGWNLATVGQAAGQIGARLRALVQGVTLKEIDGGAFYYSSNDFTYAAAPNFTWTTYTGSTPTTITGLGWDDPRWFPIGAWDAPLVTSADTTRWAQLGWNTVFVPTTNSVQSVVAAAGLAVVQTYEIYQGTALPGAAISGTTLTLGSSATLTTGEAIYGPTVAAGTTIVTGGTGTSFAVSVSQTVASTVLYAGGTQVGPAWPPSSETVGLLTYDEPSTYNQGIYYPLSGVPNADQNNRFWWLNNTWNWIAYGGLSGQPGGGTGISACNAAISELVATPSSATTHIGISTIDEYFFAGYGATGTGPGPEQAGVLWNIGGTATYATQDQLRRGSNYGAMIDQLRLRQTTYPAPIYAYIENGGPYTQDTTGASYIQPWELNWAVWSAIIHGARGIIFFNNTAAGPGVSDDNMASSYFQTIQSGQTISMFTQTQQTCALVQQMAVTINSPTAPSYASVSPPSTEIATLPPSGSGSGAFVGGIEIMCKCAPGGFYIFATTSYSQTVTAISATFTVQDKGATSAVVIGESRSIAIINGVFTDTFANAWTVHIYQIVTSTNSLSMAFFDVNFGVLGPVSPGGQFNNNNGIFQQCKPCVAMDLVWDEPPLDELPAVNSPYAVQLITNTTTQAAFDGAISTALASGSQWVEVHQAQGNYLGAYFLTGDPAWTQQLIYQDGADFTFSGFQQFTYAGSEGMIFTGTQVGTYTGYWEILVVTVSAGMAIGFAPITYSGANPKATTGASGVIWLQENGSIWNSGVVVGSLGTSLTNGATVRIYLDGNGHYSFATSTTNWGGSYTDAQTAAGTGVFALGVGFPTPPYAPFVALNGSGTQACKATSSSANCMFPIITGAAYLTPNAILSILSTSAVKGGHLQVAWVAGNVNIYNGLQYQLDGGAWTTFINGAFNGASGVAQAPNINDYLLHQVAIREVTNTLDVTAPTPAFAAVPGTVVQNSVQQLTGTTTETLSLGGTYGSVLFAVNAQGLAGSATPGGTISFQDGTTDAELLTFGVVSGNVVISASGHSNFGTTTGTLTCGPITGTLTASSMGTMAYSVTGGGQTVSGSLAIGSFAGISQVALRQAASSGLGNEFGVSVSLPAATPHPAAQLIVVT
jgi:hypothetical protein